MSVQRSRKALGSRESGVARTTGHPRLGVAAIFFLTGLVFATWSARVPDIKHGLGLDDSGLAIAFIGMNAGAIAGLQVGGLVVPRLGSRRVLRWSLPAFAAGLVGIALAPDGALLTVSLAVSSGINSMVDIAMNAHGVAVEQRFQQPLLSRFHAMHPLGGIAGSALGAVAAALGLAIIVHFAVVTFVVCALAVWVTGQLLPATVDAAQATGSSGAAHMLAEWITGWSRTTLLFGFMAFCVTLVEGSVLDWGAVYLRDVLGASPSGSAAGVTVFLTGTTLGRLAGDRIIAHLGPRRAFQMSGTSAALGLGMALLVDTVALAFVGFAMLGAGISYLLPLLFSVIGSMPGQSSAASSVARVSTLGYFGSFVGPAVIGALARISGLTMALVVPVALIAAAVLAARYVLGATYLARQ